MGRPPRPTDDGLFYHALIRATTATMSIALPHALAHTHLRHQFRLYGDCLTTNHFHLLLRPEPGVTTSRVFQSLSVAPPGGTRSGTAPSAMSGGGDSRGATTPPRRPRKAV
ncbi:MAG: hypothetical protein WKF75_13395 [Singulisphaera sp.]